MRNRSNIHRRRFDALDLDRRVAYQQRPQNHLPNAADNIMRAVIPDALEGVEFSAPEPLPVAQLLSTPRDGSLAFAMARIDRSGRLYDQLVSKVAAWSPGASLEVLSTPKVIVFRPHLNGLKTVPNPVCVVIPAAARRRFMIQAGDRVLLAAIPGHGIVVAYPLSTLDEALAAFHSQANPAQ